LEFIKKHTPDRFYLEDYTRLSIREMIFREMIVNFLVHREYANPYPARITIYKDTVVSENWTVAKTIGLITPQNVMPYPKNPVIVNCFRQMNRAEDLGSGIRNLYRWCPIYVNGALPIMEDGDIFRLTVHYEPKTTGTTTQSIKETPKSNAEKIIALIKENSKITIPEMAEKLSVTKRTIERILASLAEEGIIQRKGAKKDGERVVIDK
jgi:ATP-dependent DNA helicase RecG